MLRSRRVSEPKPEPFSSERPHGSFRKDAKTIITKAAAMYPRAMGLLPEDLQTRDYEGQVQELCNDLSLSWRGPSRPVTLRHTLSEIEAGYSPDEAVSSESADSTNCRTQPGHCSLIAELRSLNRNLGHILGSLFLRQVWQVSLARQFAVLSSFQPSTGLWTISLGHRCKLSTRLTLRPDVKNTSYSHAPTKICNPFFIHKELKNH